MNSAPECKAVVAVISLHKVKFKSAPLKPGRFLILAQISNFEIFGNIY
jgi:hypothetical protein